MTAGEDICLVRRARKTTNAGIEMQVGSCKPVSSGFLLDMNQVIVGVSPSSASNAAHKLA